MGATRNTEIYLKARDLLLGLNGDYAKAVEQFAWPELEGHFNWAVDWFDVLARDNDRDGAVDRRGGRHRERAHASTRWRAARTRSRRGSRRRASARGDRVMLMLGNQVELWESMLAVMKLGAVIMPTTTALGPGRPGRPHRPRRRAARHRQRRRRRQVRRRARATTPGSRGRTPPAGWRAYARRVRWLGRAASAHPGTAPDDPLLLYFTSGTTSQPKLVEHTQVSYPVGHLSTMYWLGLRPGDVHLNISSPGWAKHAWSCFFAPWIAEATIFVYNYAPVRRRRAAAADPRARGHDVLRAADGVADADQGRPVAAARARCGRCVGAGEPLNPEVIEQVRAAVGADHARRLRPDRDHRAGRQHARAAGQARLDGPAAARRARWCWSTRSPASRRRRGRDLPRPARARSSLMTGYQGDAERNAEAMAGGYYHTGDVASRDADGYITYIGRTDDVFKASDYKISPFELESVLIEHPAVAEAAVVPAPDAVRLAVPKAYVALARGVGAGPRDRAGDPASCPGEARAVPAGAPAGVLRAAEDDVGQDPPGRAPGPRAGGRVRGRVPPGVARRGVSRAPRAAILTVVHPAARDARIRSDGRRRRTPDAGRRTPDAGRRTPDADERPNPAGLSSKPLSGGVAGVGQGLPGDEEDVRPGRTLLLGEPLRVRHGDAHPGVRALKPTSVTGPRPRLSLPPHSQDGTAVPSWYFDWNPSAWRSRSLISG